MVWIGLPNDAFADAKHTVKRGRPAGSTASKQSLRSLLVRPFEALRAERGIAQERDGSLSIERSHMGKIEREHMPTLALILKIAAALDVSAADDGCDRIESSFKDGKLERRSSRGTCVVLSLSKCMKTRRQIHPDTSECCCFRNAAGMS